MAFNKVLSKRQVIAVIVLLTWLTQVIPLLFVSSESVNQTALAYQDISDKNNKPINSADDIEMEVRTELWTAVFTRAAMAGLGIISAMMALLSIRMWQVAVVLTSSLYLVVWYSFGPTAYVPLTQAYELKWMMATVTGTQGFFILRDILLPAIYIAIIFFITGSFFTNKKRGL